MAKIKIIGSNKILEVSQDRAKSLKKDIEDGTISKEQWLNIDWWSGQAKDIKWFEFEEEKQKPHKYDLDETFDRQEIINFGKELKKIANEGLKKELNYYGKPINSEKYLLLKGFVSNDVLRYVHWSYVEYAERMRAIFKRSDGYSDGYWVIAAEVKENWEGGNCIARAWNEWQKLRKGLQELQDRRDFYKKIEKNKIDKIAEEKLKDSLFI